MINDVTKLRFYGEDGRTPRIGMRPLHELTQALIAVPIQLTDPVGVHVGPGGDMLLIAPPREACLELLLSPVMHVPDFETLESLSSNGAHLILEGAKEYGDVLSFIWTMTFGGLGLIDLWNRSRRGEEPKPETRLQEISVTVASIALDKPDVLNWLRGLSATAAATGAERVTIEVDGRSEVELYSKVERRQRGLVARKAGASRESGKDEMLNIDRPKGLPRRMVYQGGLTPVFLAQTETGETLLFVWPLGRQPPEIASTIKGRFISNDELEPYEDVREDEENADGVFLVTGIFTTN